MRFRVQNYEVLAEVPSFYLNFFHFGKKESGALGSKRRLKLHNLVLEGHIKQEDVHLVVSFLTASSNTRKMNLSYIVSSFLLFC